MKSAKGYAWAVVLVAWSISTAQAQRPRKIDELGMTFRQRAYRVAGKVVWLDEHALKRDFAELRGLSRPDLVKWILDHASYATEQQLVLRGNVLPAFDYHPDRELWIFHPFHYHRAGVVEAGSGLLDLKGVGWGTAPYGSSFVSNTHTPTLIRIIKGDIPNSSSVRGWIDDRLRNARRELKEVTTGTDGVVRNPQRRDHAIYVEKGRIQIWKFMARLLKRRTWPWVGKLFSVEQDLRAFSQLAKQLDYVSGGAHLYRLMKEVVVQKTAQNRIDRGLVAEDWSTLPSTVDSYFLIELPWDISANGRTSPAGILGRRAHWRWDPQYGSDYWEKPFDSVLGIQDGYSAIQSGSFRELVDFENVSVDGIAALATSKGELKAPIEEDALEKLASHADIQTWVDGQRVGFDTEKSRFTGDGPDAGTRRFIDTILQKDMSSERFSKLVLGFQLGQVSRSQALLAFILAAEIRPMRTAEMLVAVMNEIRMAYSKVSSVDIQDVWGLTGYLMHVYWRLLKSSPQAARLVTENAIKPLVLAAHQTGGVYESSEDYLRHVEMWTLFSRYVTYEVARIFLDGKTTFPLTWDGMEFEPQGFVLTALHPMLFPASLASNRVQTTRLLKNVIPGADSLNLGVLFKGELGQRFERVIGVISGNRGFPARLSPCEDAYSGIANPKPLR